MVPEWFGYFLKYRGVTGNSLGKLMCHMGHRGEEVAPPHGSPNWTRGRGRGPPSLLPLPLFPFPPSIGRDEGLTRTRSPDDPQV